MMERLLSIDWFTFSVLVSSVSDTPHWERASSTTRRSRAKLFASLIADEDVRAPGNGSSRPGNIVTERILTLALLSLEL
jgi:hypothetical protein